VPFVLGAAALAGLLALMAMLAATAGASAALGAAGATAAPGVGGSKSSPSDCGLFWRVVPSSNPGTQVNFFNSVTAISANDVWTVGFYDEMVGGGTYPRATAQHWDGTAWSVVTVPQPGVASMLDSVSAVSANDIWAVGYYETTSPGPGLTLALHWDGSTWTQVISPNPGGSQGNYLTGVAGVATDAVWASGSQGNQTLMLFWDGTTWSSIPTPAIGATSFFYSVSAASVDDVWAVGTYREAQSGYDQTLAMHCGRSGCTIATTPDPGVGHNDLTGVAALSSSEVWAVGYSEVMTSPGQNLPLVLRWNGLGWSTLPTPPVPPNMDFTGLSAVVALSSNDIWGLGAADSNASRQSNTYAVHWNGSAWTLVTSPNVGRYNNFNAGAALSSGDIWAVGDYQAADPYPYLNLAEHYSDPCATPSPTPTNIPSPSPTPASCSIQFTDVPAGSTFYSYVHCLACQNILGGYTSGCPTVNPCFKPGNPVTRGQLAKIVSNAAGYNDQHNNQIFQDVPVGSAFYDFVERLASRSITGGYACGGAGEPCVPPANLPYFRPNAQVTRAQTSKIVAIAASLAAPPSGQHTFQDVPVGSTFWQWIESLATAGTIGGYPCGGAGEPCVPPQNRPYFRPNNDVTRGQAAKIVSNTFFPNCQASEASR
jgi:hypothetical protein